MSRDANDNHCEHNIRSVDTSHILYRINEINENNDMVLLTATTYEGVLVIIYVIYIFHILSFIYFYIFYRYRSSDLEDDNLIYLVRSRYPVASDI